MARAPKTAAAATAKKIELSRDLIIDRAVEIADAEGLDAVGIRRLGQEFAVTPMALYWHVQNKDELLAAMGDRLFAGVTLTVDPSAPWDERLRELMVELVAALRRHPALLPLAFERVLACPDGLALTETALQVLRDGGFDAAASTMLATHAMRSAMGLVTDEPGTTNGLPDPDQDEHLAQKRAALTVLPAELYPRLMESADYLLACNDQRAYDNFGIDLFLAGVRGLAERAAQSRV